jgi:DNA-binding NarL/FixJ family response regulator
MLRVLIADDHPLLLAGVREILERDAGFEVVGEAHSGPEVVPLAGQLQPDVVLLDMRMPGLDGFGCLDRLRARYEDIKVVVLSMCADPEQVQAAFHRGACGYVLKTIDPSGLASAIRAAVDGTAYHALGLPALTEDSAGKDAGLTQREIEIVKAVANGLSNQAISRQLWVTEQTVKFHLTNIYRKLGVANRTGAARWAFAKGLVGETQNERVV